VLYRTACFQLAGERLAVLLCRAHQQLVDAELGGWVATNVIAAAMSSLRTGAIERIHSWVSRFAC
jgi:hypothetical protein